MKNYKKGCNVVYSCKYHVVWRPKYRVEMKNGEVRDIEVDRGKLQNRNGVGVYGVKVNRTSGDVIRIK